MIAAHLGSCRAERGRAGGRGRPERPGACRSTPSRWDQRVTMLIDVRQIKAARALLRWRQDRLARQAGLALATIRRLERLAGRIEANFDTVEKIRRALEAAGIAF